MIVLGEKLRRVSQTTQLVWEVESEALFLKSSESVQLCWVSMKGYHIQKLLVENVRVVYMNWHKKRTYHVYQVSPAGCTSIRIVTTLEYE
jgi:hypothetical protein